MMPTVDERTASDVDICGVIFEVLYPDSNFIMLVSKGVLNHVAGNCFGQGCPEIIENSRVKQLF